MFGEAAVELLVRDETLAEQSGVRVDATAPRRRGRATQRLGIDAVVEEKGDFEGKLGGRRGEWFADATRVGITGRNVGKPTHATLSASFASRDGDRHAASIITCILRRRSSQGCRRKICVLAIGLGEWTAASIHFPLFIRRKDGRGAWEWPDRGRPSVANGALDAPTRHSPLKRRGEGDANGRDHTHADAVALPAPFRPRPILG